MPLPLQRSKTFLFHRSYPDLLFSQFTDVVLEIMFIIQASLNPSVMIMIMMKLI